MSSTLEKIRKERLDKVKALRKLGINPYPSKAVRTHHNKELIENYSKLKAKEVTVVGRIMSWREHGALRFANIQDNSGNIQLIIRKDAISKSKKTKQNLDWSRLHLLDIGDYVQAEGIIVKSKTDEISVDVGELKILSKSIRPLPEKWEGIQDIETKIRRRYLDMTMNPKVREMFVKKNIFWKSMREFLEDKGFIEIRTPVLEHTTGGADANPFITHHDALNTDFYLRISLELPLKRAIGGGFEKVFEIGPVFRNEGIDDEHLQDYDMMEFYWAYENYKASIELVEELYKYVAEKTFKTLKFKIRGFDVDLSKKWEEIDYVKTIYDRFHIDVIKAKKDKIRKKLDDLKVKYDKNAQKPRLVDNLWKQIRQEIAGPVFLINQPRFVSPLAKSKPREEHITERYQIILAGSEMGNGYTELNDPIDQFKRFIEQQKMRDSGDSEAQMLDIDFVEMLEYGMPPTTGFGVSERLFSYLADMPIRQTVMFPQMRKFVEQTTKEIYEIDNKNINKDKDERKRFNELGVIDTGITRKKAIKLVKSNTSNKNLVKHMLASEAAMREYAEFFAKKSKLHKDNIETWAIAGLVHDITFEKDPKGHMHSGAELLRKEKVSDYILQAIEEHGDFKPKEDESLLDEVLRIAEESTGLVVAATLVLPSKKLKDLTVKSIVKKFKTRRFAAKINRDGIEAGVERLGLSLMEHFGIVLSGMKKISSDLGL